MTLTKTGRRRTSSPKKTASKDKPKIAPDMEERIFNTLLEVMNGSDSDSVRVAAAKALMDRILRNHAEDENADRHDDEEYQDLLAEAHALLEECAVIIQTTAQSNAAVEAASGGSDGAG